MVKSEGAAAAVLKLEGLGHWVQFTDLVHLDKESVVVNLLRRRPREPSPSSQIRYRESLPNLRILTVTY